MAPRSLLSQCTKHFHADGRLWTAKLHCIKASHQLANSLWGETGSFWSCAAERLESRQLARTLQDKRPSMAGWGGGSNCGEHEVSQWVGWSLGWSYASGLFHYPPPPAFPTMRYLMCISECMGKSREWPCSIYIIHFYKSSDYKCNQQAPLHSQLKDYL